MLKGLKQHSKRTKQNPKRKKQALYEAVADSHIDVALLHACCFLSVANALLSLITQVSSHTFINAVLCLVIPCFAQALHVSKRIFLCDNACVTLINAVL